MFFPKVCYTCSYLLSDNESYICTACRHDLPVTNFHFTDDDYVSKIFYGRVKIENATALLRFEKKSLVQILLHNLKYKGFEDIGVFLGDWLGGELKTIEHYQSVDIVLPVPLHKKKLQKRGYNQVAKFAKQIAKALDAKYIDNVLVKVANTKSQVFKSRFMRWNSTNDIFMLQDEECIKGRHILLVDDIITTGATIETCAQVLHESARLKISVAAMAIAM